MRTAAGSSWVRPVAAAVLLVGFVITGVLTWASYVSNDRSATGLLRLEANQTGSALGAALPGVQRQLADALTVATATGSPSIFTKFINANSTTLNVASESLWERTSSGTVMVALSGKQPLLTRDGQATAFFAGVKPSAQLQVTKILAGSPPRVGYAEFPKGDSRFLVYAESALPGNKHLTIPERSPYRQLNFAVYLGRGTDGSQLIESSVPTPVKGKSAVATVPFGNSALTLVATPRAALTSATSRALPWIVLGGGVAVSLASAGIVDYLSQRRRLAVDLNAQLGQMYTEQRSIAETLQHALLPEHLPAVAGMEIAARYRPGAADVNIGGDWYDVVVLDRDRFVFIVGDVSGRGVRAAAVMASLRFASRTLAQEGHSPAEILGHLAKTHEFGADGHFATVLCGLVDVTRHEVTLANAGHLPPVVRSADGVAVLGVAPMPPVGTATDARAEMTTLRLPDKALLLAYTDGLVERRDEDLDQSIARLQRSAAQPADTVDALLGSIISDLTMNAPADDIALIGLQWQS